MQSRSILCLSALLAAHLTGCAEENPGFFIKYNAAPDDQCLWSTSSAMSAAGLLDLEFSLAHYGLYPVYQSQLRSRASTGPDRVEINGVQVMGAEIRLTDAAGGTLNIPHNDYSVTANGYVPTALDNTPGETAGYIEIIPYSIAQEFRDAGLVSPGGLTNILAHVTVFGVTVGGQGVEADEWTWPITLCSGCLHCAGEVPDVTCAPGQDNEGWFTDCPTP